LGKKVIKNRDEILAALTTTRREKNKDPNIFYC